MTESAWEERMRLKKLAAEELTVALKNVWRAELFDDPTDNTARRIVDMWEEFLPAEDLPFIPTTFPCDPNHPQIVVANIEFASLCMHHLVPFYGVMHVGYLPHSLQIGLSKIPRAVRYFSRRPQSQERLTSQVADWLKKVTDANGVIAVAEARHTCMSCRGVESMNATMKTTVLKGIYLTNDMPRAEFWHMVGNRKEV